MKDRTKIFWSYDEISKNDRLKLKSFKELNELLENNTSISVEQVEKSYLKILLEEDFEKNKFEYSELDFTVKKVIEDSNEAINAILLFLDKKFPKKSSLIKETLWEFFTFPEETAQSIVNTIIENKIWYITLHTWISVVEVYFDFENFEFWEALKRLRNNLIKGFKKEEK